MIKSKKEKSETMYNIDRLSEKCGVSRRTVRYYIQRGLLPPPEGKLKGAYYTDKHLKRLEEIKSLSAEGVPLNMMRDIFEKKITLNDIPCVAEDEKVEKTKVKPIQEPENIWIHLEIEEGVEFNFRKDKADKINLNKLINDLQKKLRSCYYVK